MGGGDHCYFLDAVATVVFLTTNKKNVNLVKIRTVHFE